MERPYKGLVAEVIKHIEYARKNTGAKAPVYIYVKEQNIHDFTLEAKLQFEEKYPNLKINDVHCIERYMSTNLHMLVFIITQPTYDWRNPYMRYETVGPTIIFNDMR